MSEKDFRKMKRLELYEIMLAQGKEIDRLRNELDDVKQQLADKRLAIENTGSLAEASLAITKVFEEAQKAADIYISNVTAQAGDKND